MDEPTSIHTTFVPAGYVLPAPSTKSLVVVNESVTLYTYPSILEDNAGRFANATEPAALYVELIAASIASLTAVPD